MRWLRLASILFVINQVQAESLQFVVAQCRATCTGKFEAKTRQQLSSSKRLISKCWSQCHALPRRLMSHKGSGTCISICNTSQSDTVKAVCLHSCGKILADLLKGKHGSCPVIARGFALAIVSHCNNDFDCHNGEKCCENKDGRMTCHSAAMTVNQSLPKQPSKPQTNIIKRNLKLTWERPSTDSDIVYIVQRRYSNSRLLPLIDDMTFWEIVDYTREHSLLVKRLTPAAWYQFRVAAVSADGHNDFSLPTDPVQMPTIVRKPSPPRRFHVVEAKVIRGQVDVTFSWEEPEVADAPVKCYKIVYLKNVHATSTMFHPIMERKLKVPGANRTATLRGLEQNSKYSIEIHAVLLAKGTIRVKGERLKVEIETPGFETEPSTVRVTSVFTTRQKPTRRPYGESNVIFSVEKISVDADRRHISAVLKWQHNDTISGLSIYWNRVNCSGRRATSIPMRRVVMSDPTYFVLNHLTPSCHYIIKVQPFNDGEKDGEERTLYISTDVTNLSRSSVAPSPDANQDKDRSRLHGNSSATVVRWTATLLIGSLVIEFLFNGLHW